MKHLDLELLLVQNEDKHLEGVNRSSGNQWFISKHNWNRISKWKYKITNIVQPTQIIHSTSHSHVMHTYLVLRYNHGHNSVTKRSKTQKKTSFPSLHQCCYAIVLFSSASQVFFYNNTDKDEKWRGHFKAILNLCHISLRL